MSTPRLEEIILSGRSVRTPFYFNGRLLSAEDLGAEHDAALARERSLARSIGAGVVHGLTVRADGAAANGAAIVTVTPGLALNRCGQAVELCDEVSLTLERPASPATGTASRRVFGPCGPAGAGSAPPLTGAYLLTVEPVAKKEGRAPVSGLGNTIAPCNASSLAEGVQFRLVPLQGHGVSIGPRLRNELAWYCLGRPAPGTSAFHPEPRGSASPWIPPLDDASGATRLATSEVPLALLFWSNAATLAFVDLWAVRRFPVPPDDISGLGSLIGSARSTALESAVLQFDAHFRSILAESGPHTGLVASSRFRYLPPVGFLPVGGGAPSPATFLGPHFNGQLVPLDPGSLRAVLQRGLQREPWPVMSAADAAANPGSVVPVTVHSLTTHPSSLLFVRTGRGETTAAEVHFDNRHCQLPDADTVQEALDALCDLQRSCCTLVVRPGPGWETVFNRIAPGQDAEICFQTGDYPLNATVTVQGRGHLRLVGAGPGTRIAVQGSESALVFRDCASLQVETLRATADTTGSQGTAQELRGVLTFLNCPQVDLDHVHVTCAAGPSRSATAITIRNTAFNGTTAARSTARVEHCTLDVGHEQTGLLLVNVGRTQVEDNVIRVGAGIATAQALVDPEFRGRIRRHFFDSMVAGTLPEGMRRETNATVTFNDAQVHFLTEPSLTSTANRNDNAWQTVIRILNPTGMTSAPILARHLLRLGDEFIRTGTFGTTSSTALPAALVSLRASLVNTILPALSQGIAVGGRLAGEVRIRNNTILGAQQGIHVGLSHRENARGTPDSSGLVLVEGNTLQVRLPNSATRERHGIFIGNCRNLEVSSNQLEALRGSRMGAYRLEGIRIFGHLDRRAILRANALTGFTIGIRFNPHNRFTGGRQWIVADTLAVGASPVVQFPTGLTGLRLENNSA